MLMARIMTVRWCLRLSRFGGSFVGWSQRSRAFVLTVGAVG
jgi:hypothetical protein